MKDRPLSFEGLPLKENEQLNYCPTTANQSIVSSNPYAAEVFQNFLNKLAKQKNKYQFIDKAVMWSLFQVNIRPDATSVHSGLQLIYKVNGKEFFWNFKDKNNNPSTSTYIYALKEILKKHQSRYSLYELAKVLDQYLPSMIPIGPSLSNFLSENTSEIKKYKNFTDIYFKAYQVLNPRESIPKLIFRKLVSSHPTKSEDDNYLKVDYMFKSKDDPSLECSFDINAYKHSIFIVSRESIGRYNNFGLSEDSQNTFLAVTHYKPKLKPYRSSYLFEGRPVSHHSALCHYKSNEKEIHLLSSYGRDPGQFIYQFFENGQESMQSVQDIDRISRKARVLKLYSPERYLVESHRAPETLLKDLHLLDHPVYHASTLGELTFWVKTRNDQSFVTDSRSSTIPLCQN
jgi:hypothetical protein